MRNNHTQLVVILDRSGSMDHLIDSTIEGYNKLISSQKEFNGTAEVMLVQFDDVIETIYDRDLRDVPLLTKETYFARNSTSLNDAIGETFKKVGNKLAALPEHERPEHVLVSIFTDGHENSSKIYTRHQAAAIVKHQQEKYGWKVSYFGANQNAEVVGSTYNIPMAQSFTYQANPVSMTNSMNVNSRMYSAFRSFDTIDEKHVNNLKAAVVGSKVLSEDELDTLTGKS